MGKRSRKNTTVAKWTTTKLESNWYEISEPDYFLKSRKYLVEESLATWVSSALFSGGHKGGSFLLMSIVIQTMTNSPETCNALCPFVSQLQTDSDESQVTLRHSPLVLFGIFLPP